MRAVVAEALQRSDVIIITGGLGPTSDDFTRDVVAELLGRKLVRDEAVAAHIAERMRKRGIKLPDSVYVQALVPEGAQVLPNANGTAPGLAIEHESKLVLLLPGPPRELKPMFEESGAAVAPEAHRRTSQTRLPRVQSRRTGRVACRRKGRARCWPISAGSSWATAREWAKSRCASSQISNPSPTKPKKRIRAALGDHIFGMGEDRLEEVVVRKLIAARKTIAVAESCTGGLIANRITNVSGSSEVFLNGWVTYSNESKMRLLGVREETLKKFGAVSEEVAREMAEGARQRSEQLALSTTGIAVRPAARRKPVGWFTSDLRPATPSCSVTCSVRPRTFKFFASQTRWTCAARTAAECTRSSIGFWSALVLRTLAVKFACRNVLQIASSQPTVRLEDVCTRDEHLLNCAMIRAFIAVEIPEDIRAAIADAQARLKRARSG